MVAEPRGRRRRRDTALELDVRGQLRVRRARGERVVYLSRHGGWGSISLRDRRSTSHSAPYDRYSLGIHYIAFAASSRYRVDERADWLRKQGAQIESAPREYGYMPGYYAVFLYDPDGLKLEIVHRPVERDLVRRGDVTGSCKLREIRATMHAGRAALPCRGAGSPAKKAVRQAVRRGQR